MLELKKELLLQFQKVLDDKIDDFTKAIITAKESRDSETKSSAGDKYETGRAMMHIEIQNNEIQLTKTLKQRNELNQINLQEVHQAVRFGSVIKTNLGNYFISVAVGSVELNGEDYFSISLASPIGSVLHGKRSGEQVDFQGKTYQINTII